MRSNGALVYVGIIVWLVVIVATAIALAGCQPAESPNHDVGTYEPSDPGGFVVTPRGGVGIDLGGGVYIDPATGGVGVGIPF
ncbi:hypothetical protein [Mycolicibacterium palauense]|uniref:hypothetical protein n=1 Tax=Mycolicibacterium palauense TaxID=2034511 RepID=UPI001C3F1F60|nr:hypothetical protein [Mycolicibacterium palauense]